MHSFDIKNSVQLFEALKEANQDLFEDPLSSRKAVVCAMLCWHLADWLYQEYEAIQNRYCEKWKFHRDITSKCSALAIMQDITNGTKHKVVINARAGITKTESHPGAFSPAFSRAFDRAELVVHLSDGTDTAFDLELKNAIEFWVGFLHGEFGVQLEGFP